MTANFFIQLRQMQQQRPNNWASSSDAIGRADAAQTRRRRRRAEVLVVALVERVVADGAAEDAADWAPAG